MLVIVVALIAAAAAAWFLFGRGGEDTTKAARGKGDPNARPVPVMAAAARKGNIEVYIDALGTVTPRNMVVVRSRVDGQLLSVAFREGQDVKAGDLLAQIDPRPFEVMLTQANGQMAHDQAQLKNSELDLERYRTLLSQDSISKQQVDTQEALVRQNQGTVATDQGAIDNAKLQLTYARITAPIGGRVGLRQVDPGNMVHASDANGLVTIAQVKPISVIYPIPEDNVPRVVKRTRSIPRPAPSSSRPSFPTPMARSFRTSSSTSAWAWKRIRMQRWSRALRYSAAPRAPSSSSSRRTRPCRSRR
jgi:multidrug efflux system membrane fusion protein